jgi:hypothetical protein
VPEQVLLRHRVLYVVCIVTLSWHYYLVAAKTARRANHRGPAQSWTGHSRLRAHSFLQSRSRTVPTFRNSHLGLAAPAPTRYVTSQWIRRIAAVCNCPWLKYKIAAVCTIPRRIANAFTSIAHAIQLAVNRGATGEMRWREWRGEERWVTLQSSRSVLDRLNQGSLAALTYRRALWAR